MVQTNIKVKNLFTKHLKPLNLGYKLSEFELEMIMKAMQHAYDVGHGDGYAQAFYDYNEIEEKNGNL